MASKSEFSNIDLQPIRSVLGDQTPELPPGTLGRFRLVQALRSRFGENFRMIPAAKRALKHFDQESEQVRGFMKMKEQIDGERR